MSDQTINQTRSYLNDLNWRMKKLGRSLDQLEILAYRYQRLSAAYKELYKALDHMDVLAFEIRQEFEQIRGVCRRVDYS